MLGGNNMLRQPSLLRLLKTRRCGENPSCSSLLVRLPRRGLGGGGPAPPVPTPVPSGEGTNAAAAAALLAGRRKAALAQRRAYEHYRRRDGIDPSSSGGNGGSSSSSSSTTDERNARLAWYAAATVIGALGATYAAVPLYKVFCQTTGFGGTTQRVSLADWAEKREARESSSSSSGGSGGGGGGGPGISRALWERLLSASNVPREMLPASAAAGAKGHARTWTDEEAAAKLASLRPRRDGRLITVRFDSTVGDVLPWTFVPAQLDVKVVPGETALSFFTATNKSDKAITGVATYNVHPPKVGLYFNKIQCFCFEEQRLLPGETVDMPVFFFIDPEIVDDPQLRHVNNVTLSYTFFQTDVDYDEDDEDDEDEEEVGGGREMAR